MLLFRESADTFVSRVKLTHRKSTGKMSRNIFLLCVVAVLLQWQPWSAVSALPVPPKGYRYVVKTPSLIEHEIGLISTGVTCFIIKDVFQYRKNICS